MLKIALAFELLFFCAMTSIYAQKKIGFACGLSSIDAYDERLDLKVFSGTTAKWLLSFENKASDNLMLDYQSAILTPEKKGLMATKDELYMQLAKLSYAKNYSLNDTSTYKSWQAKYGFTTNISGRYGIHTQSSSILPYDEAIHSYQLSLTLGIHIGMNYVLPSKNQIHFNIIVQCFNTGINNPYSPHGNASVYQTLVVPRFLDLSLPLAYSHRFSNKTWGKFQLNAEYYRYHFEQENKILNLSALIGVYFAI